MISYNDDYLLLMGCSQRKKPLDGVMAALDRYNGPLFQDYRALLREGRAMPRTLILSAGYGLIEPETLISDYDQLITDESGDAMARNRANLELFRLHYARAEVTLSVAGCAYDRIFRQWLAPTEVYAREARGIGWKRRTMGEFIRAIPRAGERRVA